MSSASTAVRVSGLVVDCNDLAAVPAFWASLLQLREVFRDESWVELEPLGTSGPALSFQRVPEPKAIKNRLHLDIAVPDVVATGRAVLDKGASAASALHEGWLGPWQVWRDPEGNEFCLSTAPS